MQIEDFLSQANAIVDVRVVDKNRLLQDLSERAAGALHLDSAYVAQEILKREALGSTGVGNGIAIPHARLHELQQPFGVLARLKRAIEFDAIDAKPVDLVFLLLLPGSAQSEQLSALAAVARTLRVDERLGRMRRAESSAALYTEVTH